MFRTPVRALAVYIPAKVFRQRSVQSSRREKKKKRAHLLYSSSLGNFIYLLLPV